MLQRPAGAAGAGAATSVAAGGADAGADESAPPAARRLPAMLTCNVARSPEAPAMRSGTVCCPSALSGCSSDSICGASATRFWRMTALAMHAAVTGCASAVLVPPLTLRNSSCSGRGGRPCQHRLSKQVMLILQTQHAC